jgi:tRNA(Ile)-lysidine synthase
VLLQLLRGAGPKGLAGMPESKSLGAGHLVRPLLSHSRQDFATYAKVHQLQWIDDESNANQQFTRNFIRHDIVSRLRERWPSVTATLARVADHCAETDRLVESMASADYLLTKGQVTNTLSVKKLLQLAPERQRHVFRYWLKQQGFPIPGLKKLLQIQQDMLQAATDKAPHFVWQGVELRRFNDAIYALTPAEAHTVSTVYPWDGQSSLWLPGVGEMQCQAVSGQGLRAGLADLSIRFRQGGEVCRLPGRSHRHDLKKLLQSWGVPPWLRDRTPLVYVGDELAAVVGFCVAGDFVAEAGQAGYLLSLQQPKKK